MNAAEKDIRCILAKDYTTLATADYLFYFICAEFIGIRIINEYNIFFSLAFDNSIALHNNTTNGVI